MIAPCPAVCVSLPKAVCYSIDRMFLSVHLFDGTRTGELAASVEA